MFYFMRIYVRIQLPFFTISKIRICYLCYKRCTFEHIKAKDEKLIDFLSSKKSLILYSLVKNINFEQ